MANAVPGQKRRYQETCNSAIVPEKITINQYFLLIRRHQSTEVLEALESVGISGDLAIFMLSSLQTLEVGL